MYVMLFFFFPFFFILLEQICIVTATKTTKTSKMWSRPLMKPTLSSEDEKMYSCRRTVKILCTAGFDSDPSAGRPSLATAVAPVSGALYPSQHQPVGRSLAVRGEAQEAHEVDETSGKVQLAAKLAGCIVIGERVVVVVESFAYGAEGDESVLPGVDVFIVGPVPPHVGGAVHQPGGVQHQGVSQQGREEVRHQQGLPPQVPRHEHRDEEAHEEHGELVILPLKHHNFVRQKVSEFQLASFLDDVGVFAHQQPANVREEETPDGVVGVGVRLRVFVVNPVVPGPLEDVILEGHGVRDGEEDPQWQRGLVGSVTPQAMGSRGDS